MCPTNNQLSNIVFHWDLQFQNKLNSEALVANCLYGTGNWANVNDTPDQDMPPLEETSMCWRRMQIFDHRIFANIVEVMESNDSNAEMTQTTSSLSGLNGNDNHAAGHSGYTSKITIILVTADLVAHHCR
jgi:hypothetical protein